MKFRIKKTRSSESVKQTDKANKEYFVQATHWHDDVYTTILVSRNRYQIAFFAALCCVALLGFSVLSLVPLEKTQLIVVHQQQDGYSWVSTTKPSTLTLGRSEAQIKQSIGNFIRLRESYHPETYRENAQLVKYFSSSSVENAFLSEQSADDSLTTVLGKKGFRTVQIESIQLLSAEKDRVSILPTKNMALVRFTLVDKDMDGKVKNTQHEQAFITYVWIGEPENPELKLLNYDGFTITSYEKTTVNTGDTQPALSSTTSGEKTL